MKQQGLFISLEGIDGCGKTTLFHALQEHWAHQNQPLVSLREPGGTPVSEAIRQVLLNPDFTNMKPETEAFLYASARAQVCREIIQPALQQGQIVLADRFTDSTLAYQGYARGLKLPFLTQLNQLCTAGTTPDLTLLLDIDPHIAQLRRSQQHQAQDRLEQEGLRFQEKVRAGYLELAQKEPQRIKILNAAHSREQLLQEALSYIQKFNPERKANHGHEQ